MKQYLELCQRIIDEGVWVENKRTGKRCLTIINADLTYDVENGVFPLVTTRKSFYKSAIAEMLLSVVIMNAHYVKHTRL